jgi:hypothetical protein
MHKASTASVTDRSDAIMRPKLDLHIVELADNSSAISAESGRVTQ